MLLRSEIHYPAVFVFSDKGYYISKSQTDGSYVAGYFCNISFTSMIVKSTFQISKNMTLNWKLLVEKQRI